MEYKPQTYEDVFGQPEVPQYAAEQVADLQAARDRGDFASFPGYYESAIGQIKADLGPGYASWQPDEVAAPPAQPRLAPSVQAAPSVQPASVATPRTLAPVQPPTQTPQVGLTSPNQQPWRKVLSKAPSPYAVVTPQAQAGPPTQTSAWDTIPGQPQGSLAQAGSPFQQPIQPAQQVAMQSTQDFLTEGMPAVAPPGEVAAEVGGPPKAWQLQQKFQALEPGEQASLEKAGKQALPALALSLVNFGLSWPKTAKEKETERIREEYKLGKAGRAAVLAHQQASGSSAGALGAQALDAIFAASAGQGLNTAARWTQNVRAAGQFYKDVAGSEQQVLAQVHQDAEERALWEYKQSLDDPTASDRRKLDAMEKAEGLAKLVGKIQASQATSVYDVALANMTPEERIAWMKLPFEERKAMLATFSAVEPPVAAAAPTAEAKEA